MRKETLKALKQYKKELKTIKIKKIEQNPSFLTIERYQIKLNNGKTIKREKLLKNKKDGSAAIIFPMTEDHEILLAIEPRVFTKETVDIGLPAGYIEEYENQKVAAKRELLEETGYEAETLQLLGSFYQDQGCSSAYNYYYIAFNCKKVKEQQLDEGEFIKYITVTMEELEELIQNNMIQGLNSIYTIEKAKTYLKERSYE